MKTDFTYRDLVVFVLSVLAALLAVIFLFGHTQTDFDEVGLGLGTSSHYLTYKGKSIHCAAYPDAHDCVETLKNLPGKKLAWIGWSQLHGINKYQKNEKTAPWLMTDSLRLKEANLITFSLPNLTPLEQQVYLDYLTQQADLDGVILGVWLKGMTNEGVRESVQQMVKPTDRDSNKKNEIQTIQEKTESALVRYLESNTRLWAARPEAQGQLAVFFKDIKYPILQLRNWLLGMEPAKRVIPISKDRYALHLKAWQQTLEFLKQRNIKVLLYVPPRPINDFFPFNSTEYENFKQEFSQLAQQYGVPLINIEDSVKGDVWGKIKSGGAIVTDFSHFTAHGHNMLAQALLPQVERHLLALQEHTAHDF